MNWKLFGILCSFLLLTSVEADAVRACREEDGCRLFIPHRSLGREAFSAYRACIREGEDQTYCIREWGEAAGLYVCVFRRCPGWNGKKSISHPTAKTLKVNQARKKGIKLGYKRRASY